MILDNTLWRLLVLVVAINTPSTAEFTITTRPQNATAQRGSSVELICAISSTGPFTGFMKWNVYSGGKLGGEIAYSMSGGNVTYSTRFPPGKYQRVGDFGLNVSSLQWQDGAIYQCDFLQGDNWAIAEVVVIDSLELRISPDSAKVNTTLVFTCSLTFGAPEFDFGSNEIYDKFPQFPQLTMMLGSDHLFDASVGSLHYEPGKPGIKQHTIIKTANYTVTMSDVDKVLTCIVSTRNPPFTLQTNQTLVIQAPAHGVTVDNVQSQYVVGDAINCSAKGWPAPSFHWMPISVPDQSSTGSISGQSLKISSDMIGSNVWKCIAGNNIDAPAELELSFNVTAAINNPESKTEDDNGKTVGLAVGLTFGLLAIFAVAGVIVYLYIRRRKQPGRSEKKKPTVSYVPVNTDNDLKPKAAGPIYRPVSGKPLDMSSASAEPTSNLLDRSGYGDLGLGLRESAVPHGASEPSYHPRQEDSFTHQDSDRPDPAAVRGWQDPAIDHYSNVPSLSASTNTPVQATGYADLGLSNSALKASMHSMDRATDASDSRPQPNTRASNRSLNRSTDSVGHRPRNVRGSNPSLNRSDDVAVRLAGPADTKATDVNPGAKSRPATKPPLPPKKPDATVNMVDENNDFGTIV